MGVVLTELWRFNLKIGNHSILEKGFLLPYDKEIFMAVKTVLKASYWNDIHTKSGKKMSIRITNCGDLGWFSDSKGYYYSEVNPVTNVIWPPMPDILKELAIQAAELAGYQDFIPDCCLFNRYAVGTKLSLHQDVDEKDMTQPIVSFSLGIPAEFLWGGFKRDDAVQKFALEHGDIIVFGGEDRLRFHGISPIKPYSHAILGDTRINLTFRKAG